MMKAFPTLRAALRSLPTALGRGILPLLLALMLLPTALPTSHALAADSSRESRIERARELLDAQRPEAVLKMVEPLLSRGKKDGEALLLRSSAHYMLNDRINGGRDLERALELDPTLRQGWLNLAAVRLAEQNYDAALAAFEKARALDPDNPDTALNIGAVQLFAGRLSDAAEGFKAYLDQRPGSGEAHYLVAANYAITGYAALALRHLQTAIQLDEPLRLQARTDPALQSVVDTAEGRRLFALDPYRAQEGDHILERSYSIAAYDGGRGPLLGAVLDALANGGIALDPRVEVTEDWAVMWSDFRIQLDDRGAEGGGRVRLSAASDRLSPQRWKVLTDRFLRLLELEVHG
ncbi:MAG: tetratricopeptide repeat protein [Acidobacteriota bacterium]